MTDLILVFISGWICGAVVSVITLLIALKLFKND